MFEFHFNMKKFVFALLAISTILIVSMVQASLWLFLAVLAISGILSIDVDRKMIS